MDDGVHTQLYLANSALQAIANLAAAEGVDLNVTNGWRLACLLRLIKEQLFGGLGAVGRRPGAAGSSGRVGLAPGCKVRWWSWRGRQGTECAIPGKDAFRVHSSVRGFRFPLTRTSGVPIIPQLN